VLNSWSLSITIIRTEVFFFFCSVRSPSFAADERAGFIFLAILIILRLFFLFAAISRLGDVVDFFFFSSCPGICFHDFCWPDFFFVASWMSERAGRLGFSDVVV